MQVLVSRVLGAGEGGGGGGGGITGMEGKKVAGKPLSAGVSCFTSRWEWRVCVCGGGGGGGVIPQCRCWCLVFQEPVGVESVCVGVGVGGC